MSPFFTICETAYVWVFAKQGSPPLPMFLTAVAFFMLVAYLETVVEYADDSQNLREQEAQALSSNVKRDIHKDHPFNGDDLHGKLRMFPCTLRHIRRKAFKDDFQHKYLYIGVPIGLHADYAPLISVDCPSWRSVFSIRPQDQLIRGGKHLTLAQKLSEYVEEQGEDLAQWKYAYFVTSPTVLGLSNNPLAYWYLYTADKKLDAVVMQLDTSYGERRLWLKRNCRERPNNKGPYCFRAEYQKDLQVSPFMPSQDTGFILDTSDPCSDKAEPLHLMITSTHGKRTLMVTTVTPDGPLLEVPLTSTWTRFMWAWRWWLVCSPAGVVWRILSNAYRIFIFNQENICVGSRVEPIKTVTAKHARTVEKTLERYFLRLLKSAVENQDSVACVHYVTPGEHCPRIRKIYSRPRRKEDGMLSTDGIIFQVNTPTFYSRFFHYRNPRQAFEGELLDDPRTRTTWCSEPERFTSMFDIFTNNVPPPGWRWKAYALLRCPPELKNYEQDNKYQTFSGLSATDTWVIQHCTSKEQREYRRSALRVLIGERFGGVVLGPKGAHPELLGVSRDGVLRIYEAIGKAVAVVMISILSRDGSAWTSGIAFSILNLWACFKTIF